MKNYKWCNGTHYTMTKYCTDSKYGTVDNKTVLEAADDAATANWGSGWRMPTYDECKELKENCTWTWTRVNGFDGYLLTSNKSGYTDKSIFLPAAGYIRDTDFLSVSSFGFYWSKSLYTDLCCTARVIYFYEGTYSLSNLYRYCGQSVRAVRTK